MSRRWDASPVGKYKRDFDGDYLMNNINKRRGKKKKRKISNTRYEHVLMLMNGEVALTHPYTLQFGCIAAT